MSFTITKSINRWNTHLHLFILVVLASLSFICLDVRRWNRSKVEKDFLLNAAVETVLEGLKSCLRISLIKRQVECRLRQNESRLCLFLARTMNIWFHYEFLSGKSSIFHYLYVLIIHWIDKTNVDAVNLFSNAHMNINKDNLLDIYPHRCFVYTSPVMIDKCHIELCSSFCLSILKRMCVCVYTTAMPIRLGTKKNQFPVHACK